MQRDSAVRKHLNDAVANIDHHLRVIAAELRRVGNSEMGSRVRIHAEQQIVRLEADRKEITEFLSRTEVR